MTHRKYLKKKKKIVVKVGTSLLAYENGKINLQRMEKLIRVLAGLHNSGKEVILVSSGAVAVAQVLLTRDGIENSLRRKNARNTLNQLVEMGIIPVVNENDTVITDEIEFGDNDTLSASVATLIQAELLLILTDTDGVFTSDPHINDTAQKVPNVMKASDDLKDIDVKGSSKMGSGGMASKIAAAELWLAKSLKLKARS